MTFSKEDTRHRVSVRVSDDLKDYLDKQPNKSEYIRDLIHDEKGAKDPDDYPGLIPPDDPKLATGYNALLDVSDGGGTVMKSEADPYVSQRVGVKVDNLKALIYRPLMSRGYLTRQQTMDDVKITVRA